jgi:PKHD-type hydroxylase
MGFPVSYYMPQYTPFACWRGAFTPEECQKIRDLGELLQFAKGRVGSGGASAEDAATRDTDITWIEYNPDTAWIFERISGVTGRVNFEMFQLSLDEFDGFQYGRYREGQHYTWHVDIDHAPPNPARFRKLSLIMFLSDPSEYEGGDVLINVDGNPDKVERLRGNQGDILFFYSHLPHMVAPVTKGQRLTLVTWAMGEKIR